MSQTFVSDGFSRLGLPAQVVRRIVAAAARQRINGPGCFCYVPMAVLHGGAQMEIVVAFFDKEVKQKNIHARPGDVAIHLRSEWNEDENPID